MSRSGLRLAVFGAVILAIAVAAMGFLGSAGPDESAGRRTTLEKIRRTGVITLGHRENSIPFSYFDDQQHVVGYAHDISVAIAREVEREAGMPKLTVKLVPVTSQTRIPLLINNTILGPAIPSSLLASTGRNCSTDFAATRERVLF